MEILPIFPQAVIGLKKLKISSEEILKYLKNIKFELTEAEQNANYLCFVSEDKNVLEELSFLKNEIYTQIKNYLNNVMEYKMDFQFTTSWATKTKPDGYSQKHTHPNSFLSGVYYPKGDKNFNIKFFKKNYSSWQIIPIKHNELNAELHNFNIFDDNVLFLFPSDLEHAIDKNLSKEDRYSLAFNVIPLGEIGAGDSIINFK